MAENINTVNHRWIRETFEHVNLAVDATCGGGNDTVFLAGLADNVLALDIQLEAVRKTQKKTAGFTNVTVIQADHAELARWLTQPAQIIGWIAQLGSAWSVRSYTDGRPAAPVLYHLRRT